jgi:hypothetical protein
MKNHRNRVISVTLAVSIFAAMVLWVGIGCHSSTSTPAPNPTDTTGKGNPQPSIDTVEFSFAVFGCNRLAAGDTVGVPSTANIAQLDRTFTDMMNLSPQPEYVFDVGDLVLGKVTDTSILGSQLRAWRQHYEASPIASSGIKLVAVAGNHESNDGGSSSDLCEKKWLEVMSPYIVGSNGPGVGGADNLATDQSRLTYSFNYDDTHFVTMNSDPSGQGSTVPINWVSQDFAAARAAGAKHIFALAHKPAYAWENDGSSSLTTATQTALWSAMTTNHVEAMLTAHNHVYRRLQPKGSGTPWMIIPGNGGSTLDSNLPADQNYGFTVVSVMKSGKVKMKTYARAFGPLYNSPSPAATYPTTVVDTADITWGN